MLLRWQALPSFRTYRLWIGRRHGVTLDLIWHRLDGGGPERYAALSWPSRRRGRGWQWEAGSTRGPGERGYRRP